MASKTVFGAENLVALYMVGANVDTVSTKDLQPFYEYLSSKIGQHDQNVPLKEKFSSILLYSNFYVGQLKNFEPKIFNISDEDVNGDMQISCTLPQNKAIKQLKSDILTKSFNKNQKFMHAVADFTCQYMKENQIPVKKKLMSQEEDDTRWFKYFGN